MNYCNVFFRTEKKYGMKLPTMIYDKTFLTISNDKLGFELDVFFESNDHSRVFVTLCLNLVPFTGPLEEPMQNQ